MGVEEEIGQREARQVPRLRSVGGEDQAPALDPRRLGRPPQIVAHDRRIGPQPQHGLRDPAQDLHPPREHHRLDLVGAVEAAEDAAARRQPANLAHGRCRVDRLPVVGDVIGVGHERQGFAVERGLVGWRDHRVGDGVVDEVGADATREADVGDDDRRRPQGAHLEPVLVGVAVELDEEIDAVGVDLPRDGGVGEAALVAEDVAAGDDSPPVVAAVVLALRDR